MRRLFAPWSLNLALLVALALASLLSLGLGAAPLTPGEVLAGLLGTGSTEQRLIVQQIRLPRVVLAWLVGAALGASGAALQGLLRNPLAEPGLLGISASAGLGAVLTLHFGLTAISLWLLPGAAMLFALLATLALYLLTRRGASNLTLILAGVALSALAGALTSLALNLAPNPASVQDIVLWLLGSISDRSFDDVLLALPFVVLGLMLLLATAPALEVLALGEAEAASLGVDLARLRGLIVLGAALAVGSTVAVSGTIGFVGLVVPHLLRRLVHHRPGALLVPSALGGALLVLVADIALRLLDTPRELMLGVVTALVGAPFFLALVLRSRGAPG
ncbi:MULTISPECIES: FecCD family ABC transporter permease [Marichromatium]|uniref:Iron complex transport system permease protein n=1 Tax=Marichromatium gracile TaxID=1048 RepID=A0A4R4A8L4_MARGR|nr:MULTISPECIES: iron ABC transporter permease [Marichromatium]MBK1708084.1 ABC transporter permease [Marichromatium gracile]MBO8086878.1 iron ABC transporter permease [Marichromatium sp.]RNE91152.1 iron ABC transporter permease [Marichromatium sp. AB32]TCW35213.1 iron complex transport system permease protein [Marichromatium gracile]